MKTIERTKQYSASPEEVFDCLDDLGVTGMHMTQSSMPMMGGKMDLTFLTANKTGPHTKYRWTGKVLWWELDFTVEVVTWERGKEKVWETIGATKLIIYSWFRMNLNVWPMTDGSMAKLSISYEKPKGIFNRLLCFLSGDWYCRWCLKNMLNDAKQSLEKTKAATTSPET
jgi:hypothetical protein